MDSIPATQLAGIARDVAFELGRPWRVKELHAKALEAYPTAKRRAAGSGLPPEQTDELIRSLISEQVKKAGERMDPLPFGEEKPAPERIEAALGTFTSEQWERLLEDFDHVDVEALLSFIQLDAHRMKQKLGAKEVGRIEERANMRDKALWVENNRSTLEPRSNKSSATTRSGSWRSTWEAGSSSSGGVTR